MAQTTVAINLEAKTKGTESVKSLKTQIREATNEAIAIAQKFGEFSTEAITAAKRVAQLKDQMEDFQKRVQALNPDKFDAIGKLIGGVANGIQAAQGAMALFGAESEDVQKALLKVQGAMAFAQGINGVIEARKQFADFGKDAVSAFMKMTTASKAFLATGLGLIVAAIGYAVANFEQLAEAMGFAESEMQKMNKAMNIAAAETKQQAADLNYYNSVVQDTKKSEGERLFALQKLKEAGIATDDVNIANANSLQALNERVAKQIVLIAQRARTEAAAQILQEKTKKLIEMQNGDLDDQITLWDRFAEASKAAASAGLYRQDLQSRANENIKKTQEDVNKATAVYQKELEKSTKLEGVAVETSKQVTSTLKKQKEAEKELNKEKEKKHAILTREQQFLKNIQAGLAASEKVDKETAEQKQKREQAMREYRIEKAFEEVEINKKLAAEQIELEKQKAEAIKQAQQQSIQLTAQGFASIAELADAFAGKSEEQQRKAFEIKKKASMAQAVVETIQAAQSAYASQMAITTPDAPVRAAVAAALALAAGVARVRKIEQTPFEAKGVDTAGGGATPPAPSFTPITGGALPDEQQFGGMGRVYVLEGDITKTQTRVRRLRNTSVV